MNYRELNDKSNFSLFTKLSKCKINGALLSDEYLENDEKEIIDVIPFIEKKIIFGCPKCKKRCLAEIDQTNFLCDCEKIINLNEIDKDIRYVLKDDYFSKIKENIEQSISFKNIVFQCIFGEKSPSNFLHENKIFLHITPFQDEKLVDGFDCIDKAYLDHYSINWNNLVTFLNDKSEFYNKILSWRKENIQKQINWSLINDKEFQDLCYEIIKLEKMFDKLVIGGTGADQGKDMFGYNYSKSAVGRPEEVVTLIQCKFTEKNASFNSDDIFKYVKKALRHNCNYMLFITNGHLTGDASTEIHSNAYQTEKFRDVNFWDNKKIIDYLETYPRLRIKYFYSR